jgi:hypothetical protein
LIKSKYLDQVIIKSAIGTGFFSSAVFTYTALIKDKPADRMKLIKETLPFFGVMNATSTASTLTSEVINRYFNI